MARQIRREVPAVSKFKGFLATVLSLLERRLRNVDDVWQKSKYHRFTRRSFTRFYEVIHWEEGVRPGGGAWRSAGTGGRWGGIGGRGVCGGGGGGGSKEGKKEGGGEGVRGSAYMAGETDATLGRRGTGVVEGCGGEEDGERGGEGEEKDDFTSMRGIKGAAWDQLRVLFFNRTPTDIVRVLREKRESFDELFIQFRFLGDRASGLKEPGVTFDGFIDGLFVLGYSRTNMRHQLLVFRTFLKLKAAATAANHTGQLGREAGGAGGAGGAGEVWGPGGVAVGAVEFRSICLALCTPYYEFQTLLGELEETLDGHRLSKEHHILTAAEFRQRMCFLHDQVAPGSSGSGLQWAFFGRAVGSIAFLPFVRLFQACAALVLHPVRYCCGSMAARRGGGKGGSMVVGAARLFFAEVVNWLIWSATVFPLVLVSWNFVQTTDFHAASALPCSTFFEASFPTVTSLLLLLALAQYRAYNALPIHRGTFEKKQAWISVYRRTARVHSFRDGSK
jgi:hypothetical protein